MPKNSTDLHIQYKMETGESFQWDPPKSTYNHSGSGYHSTEGYCREYCKWIEEKYLELLKTNN